MANRDILKKLPYGKLVELAQAADPPIVTVGVKKEVVIDRLADYLDFKNMDLEADPDTLKALTDDNENGKAEGTTKPAIGEDGSVVLSSSDFASLMARLDKLEKSTPAAEQPNNKNLERLFQKLEKALTKETDETGLSYQVDPADLLPEKVTFWTRCPQLHMRFLMIGPAPEKLPRGLKLIVFTRFFIATLHDANSPIPRTISMCYFSTSDRLVVEKMRQDVRYGSTYFENANDAASMAESDELRRLVEEERVKLRSNSDPSHVFQQAKLENIHFTDNTNPSQLLEQLAFMRAKRRFEVEIAAPQRNLQQEQLRQETLRRGGENAIPWVSV